MQADTTMPGSSPLFFFLNRLHGGRTGYAIFEIKKKKENFYHLQIVGCANPEQDASAWSAASVFNY